MPLSKRTLTDLENSDFKGAEFYLHGVLDQNNFPLSGISINYKAIDEPKLETIRLLKAYFNSYNSPEIELIESNGVLEVKFHTFQAIRLYAQRLGRLLEQLMT